MKKTYATPVMSLIKLQAADMITTSTGEFDGEWVVVDEKSSPEKLVL